MASKKAALGRGLSALLPTQQEADEGPEAATPEAPPSRLYRFEDKVRLLGRVGPEQLDARRRPVQPCPGPPGNSSKIGADRCRRAPAARAVGRRRAAVKRAARTMAAANEEVTA